MLASQLKKEKKFIIIVGGKMTDVQVLVSALFLLFILIGVLE